MNAQGTAFIFILYSIISSCQGKVSLYIRKGKKGSETMNVKRKSEVNHPLHTTTRRICKVILLCIGFVLLFSCSRIIKSDPQNQISNTPKEYLSKTDFLLNTVVTVSLYDKQEEDLLEGCFALIRKYEAIYSRTLESSELYALNHGDAPILSQSAGAITYSISDELADIIQSALYYSKLTGGAFDLTVAPITSLWNFQSEKPVLPDPVKLDHALTLVDYRKVQLSGNEITFAKPGIGIDLGAIAKGYIADRLKSYLTENDVHSAIINLGGNILCVGEKGNQEPFVVGIQKPYAERNETAAVMKINDLSVVSSGVYERYFDLDGKIYHHILNPHTGYPYDNGLISVTILSERSVDGDGLSTSCFALGLEEGLALIERIPNTYAVFITSDYVLHYSDGFPEVMKQ